MGTQNLSTGKEITKIEVRLPSVVGFDKGSGVWAAGPMLVPPLVRHAGGDLRSWLVIDDALVAPCQTAHRLSFHRLLPWSVILSEITGMWHTPGGLCLSGGVLLDGSS